MDRNDIAIIFLGIIKYTIMSLFWSGVLMGGFMFIFVIITQGKDEQIYFWIPFVCGVVTFIVFTIAGVDIAIDEWRECCS